MLQHSTSTGIGIGAGTSKGDQDADYHFMRNGLVRFRDRIYVLNCSELKNIILKEFHILGFNPVQKLPAYEF